MRFGFNLKMARKSMLRMSICLALIFSLLQITEPVYAESPIEIYPSNIIQGDPIVISVAGGETMDTIKKIVFDNKSLWFFIHNDKPTAFVGLDLGVKKGEHIIKVLKEDGTEFERTITIGERDKVEKPLGIPEKLGGNTLSSQNQLISNLAKENATLAVIKTSAGRSWYEDFSYPLKSMILTDPYGYSRKTGMYSVLHKGADYRAGEGTAVYSINRGIVRIARQYSVYGNTIVVDHGRGIISMYMHLSKMNVKVGQMVENGQIIGLSGSTGYAEVPHLHLTVRIDGKSIDPEKFLSFFKK